MSNKSFLKVKYPKVKLVNDEYGEVVGVYQETKVSSEDEWGKLYVANIEAIYGLTTLQYEVLFGCWKFSSFSTGDTGNKIYNTKLFKQTLIDSGIDAKPASIDIAINKLSKKGILIKLGKGEYLLNPQLFFKGRRSDKCRLEHKIIYEPVK